MDNSHTLEYSKLSTAEIVDFLGFLMSPTIKIIGNLPVVAIGEGVTMNWATPSRNVCVVVEIRLLRTYPGNDSQTDELADSIRTAIGNPEICTRGHLFSILRLLGHYFRSNRDSSMISSEYIHINPDDLSLRIKQSASAPVVGSNVSSPQKKRRYSDGSSGTHPLIISEDLIEALDYGIQQCEAVLAAYTEPDTWITLSFPFLSRQLPFDRFNFTTSPSTAIPRFAFMPREFLAYVHKRVTNLGIGQSSLYLHGTMGLGKSHILAALAILLRRQGHRVVFLPDCGQLVPNPVLYVQSALLCTFSGSSEDDRAARRQIRGLETLESIQHWCNTLPKTIFIVDQLNTLETRDGKGTREEEKLHAK